MTDKLSQGPAAVGSASPEEAAMFARMVQEAAELGIAKREAYELAQPELQGDVDAAKELVGQDRW